VFQILVPVDDASLTMCNSFCRNNPVMVYCIKNWCAYYHQTQHDSNTHNKKTKNGKCKTYIVIDTYKLIRLVRFLKPHAFNICGNYFDF
jgi:uncharacterized Rmd1/YagE family protein